MATKRKREDAPAAAAADADEVVIHVRCDGTEAVDAIAALEENGTEPLAVVHKQGFPALDHIGPILTALGKHAGRIVKLDLPCTKLGDEGMLAVADLVCKCGALRELSLSWGGFSDEDGSHMKRLAAALVEAGCHIEAFNFGFNRVGAAVWDEVAAAWPTAFAHVKRLTLNSTELGDDALGVLVDAWAAGNVLESLSMFHCNITDDGACALAAWLGNAAQCKLLRLSVGQNDIKARGGKAIAKALEENAAVCSHGFSATKAKKFGAAAIKMLIKHYWQRVQAGECTERAPGLGGVWICDVSRILVQSKARTYAKSLGDEAYTTFAAKALGVMLFN